MSMEPKPNIKDLLAEQAPAQIAAKAKVSVSTIYRLKYGLGVGYNSADRVCAALGYELRQVEGIEYNPYRMRKGRLVKDES